MYETTHRYSTAITTAVIRNNVGVREKATPKLADAASICIESSTPSVQCYVNPHFHLTEYHVQAVRRTIERTSHVYSEFIDAIQTMAQCASLSLDLA